MPPYLLFSLGALTGAGVALLAPSLSRNSRPLIKEAMKTALLLARQAQVSAVQLAETMEDLYAEARAEADAEPAAAAAAARDAVARAKAAASATRKRASTRKPAAKKASRPTAKRVVRTAQRAPRETAPNA